MIISFVGDLDAGGTKENTNENKVASCQEERLAG